MEAVPEKFKIRTAYNEFHVFRHQGLLELRSGDNSLQSAIDPRAPQRLCLRNLEHLMTVLLFIPEPRNILVLGTAAGSLLHYLRHYLPAARLTAVDIDTELITQLLQLGVLPPRGDRLDYVTADAADFIAGCEQRFDLVLVDLFNGARSPAWLLERESSDALYRLCSERGAVAYNLLLASEHDFTRFYRELRQLYRGLTLSLPVQGFENRIVCAVRERAPENVDMNARLQQAAILAERLQLDFPRLLAVAYNSNPVGVGLL